MAIRFVCECGKKLSAPDFYAGREGKCDHCGKKFVIPGEPQPPAEQSISQASSVGGGTATLTQKAPKAVATVKIGPPRTARDYTYLILLVALVPLFWTMLRPENAGKRLEKTLKTASPQAQERVAEIKHVMHIRGPLPEYLLPYLDEDEFESLPGSN